MLENDKSALQSTLDIINTMSGIDDVNMYDDKDSLVYSSFSSDTTSHSNPNCLSCHENIQINVSKEGEIVQDHRCQK